MSLSTFPDPLFKIDPFIILYNNTLFVPFLTLNNKLQLFCSLIDSFVDWFCQKT